MKPDLEGIPISIFLSIYKSSKFLSRLIRKLVSSHSSAYVNSLLYKQGLMVCLFGTSNEVIFEKETKFIIVYKGNGNGTINFLTTYTWLNEK
jgi:hypothetical protein